MKQQNYKTNISVLADANTAFDAVTKGIEHWWTKPDRPIRAVGDRAKFMFPPGISYWTFEAVEMVPTSYVKLQCVDALHLHEG